MFCEFLFCKTVLVHSRFSFERVQLFFVRGSYMIPFLCYFHVVIIGYVLWFDYLTVCLEDVE